MELNKIRELEIAKQPFDISKACPEELNYPDWVKFIERYGFVWKEDTEDGRKALKNISNIPESFRARVLQSLDKKTAFYDFDKNENQYRVLLTYRSEFNYVGINIESKLSIEDLIFFVKMANHLDAFLLVDGKKIIDDKVLENLG